MTNSTQKLRLVLIAVIAMAGSVFAAESTAPAKPEAKSTASSDAKKDAAKKDALAEQYKAAEIFNKDHDALVKQLNAATDEQRKAILEKMKEREKEFEDRLNALHKQERDDQRKERKSGGSKK